MKIGILTLPISDNYGGILQTVALYRLLHRHGHDVVLIYKDAHQELWKKIIKYILLKIPFVDIKNIKFNDKVQKEWQKRKEFHREFIEQELYKISEVKHTKQDLETLMQQEYFEAVIVGSDQVWRKLYIHDKYYKSYFLDFVDSSKTKKIAYAASFGKDHWEGRKDIKEISELLKDFDAVSTRESSGVEICRETFNYSNAKHVLDPTLLMGKAFYLDEIISKYDTSGIVKGGIVTYVLDEAQDKSSVIEFIKSSQNINRIFHLKGFSSTKKIYSVPEWLYALANADFIVTDSFHGMVFSIIFEKNFVVIGNHERGLDRFTSLLSLLGLDNRLVSNADDLRDHKLNDIDYNVINKLIDSYKEKSLAFLMNAINKASKDYL